MAQCFHRTILSETECLMMQLLGLDVQNDVGNLFSGTLEVSPDGIHRIDDIDES